MRALFQFLTERLVQFGFACAQLNTRSMAAIVRRPRICTFVSSDAGEDPTVSGLFKRALSCSKSQLPQSRYALTVQLRRVALPTTGTARIEPSTIALTTATVRDWVPNFTNIFLT